MSAKTVFLVPPSHVEAHRRYALMCKEWLRHMLTQEESAELSEMMEGVQENKAKLESNLMREIEKYKAWKAIQDGK